MASNPVNADDSLPESARRLIKGYEYITGSINYEKFARDEGITNVEAARKRFKRALEAHNLSITTRGDSFVSTTGDDDTTTPSTPKAARTPRTTKATPKRKKDTAEDDENGKEEPGPKTPKSVSKKVKKQVVASKKEEADGNAEDALED